MAKILVVEDDEQLRKLLREALEDDNYISPGNTWFNMGLIYNQLKQYTTAIECYEKAMADKKYISLPNIWKELTKAYNKTGQLEKASAYLPKRERI